MIEDWDEIVSVEYAGEEETIDINVTGNRLFYANDILSHNSAVDEIEFDHSHISGGISKINTADNVFAILTSRSMRERGQYQLQLMKTRSSSGVGQKIELAFNVETLRITDIDTDEEHTYNPLPSGNDIMSKLKAQHPLTVSSSNGIMSPAGPQGLNSGPGSRLQAMLKSLK
jgi:hypothetical protein